METKRRFGVGDLVLIKLEGKPPQYGVIRTVTDDESFPYIVQGEHGPMVVTANEVRPVTVTEEKKP